MSTPASIRTLKQKKVAVLKISVIKIIHIINNQRASDLPGFCSLTSLIVK